MVFVIWIKKVLAGNVDQTAGQALKVLPGSVTDLFHIRIDGTTVAASVGPGGTSGHLVVTPGAHTIDIRAASPADINDYNVEYEGDCDVTGNITLAHGDIKYCTIILTNVPVMDAIMDEMCENIRRNCMDRVGESGGLTAAQCMGLYNACVDANQ